MFGFQELLGEFQFHLLEDIERHQTEESKKIKEEYFEDAEEAKIIKLEPKDEPYGSPFHKIDTDKENSLTLKRKEYFEDAFEAKISKLEPKDEPYATAFPKIEPNYAASSASNAPQEQKYKVDNFINKPASVLFTNYFSVRPLPPRLQGTPAAGQASETSLSWSSLQERSQIYL